MTEVPRPASVWESRPTRRTVLRAGAAAALATAAGAAAPWRPLGDALAAAGPSGCRTAAEGGRWAFGTELEYYRMDRGRIAARLDLCVQVGFTRIQTYVPWNVHENLPGTVDFEGRTHPVIVSDHVDEYQIQKPNEEIATGGAASRVVANTDLFSFIEECRVRRLEVVLRPGPFISDEWRNGGLPDWLLVEGYPAMYQRGPDGTPLTPGFPFTGVPAVVTGGGPLYYFPALSYASPEYLDAARRWLRIFAGAVRPHLAANGGPIVGFQVDDETCFFYRFGAFEVDYHPATVAAYQARFGAPPPTAWPAPGGGVAALRPALHWQRFKAEQIAGYLGTLGDALRGAGMQGPISQVHELLLQGPAGFAELARTVTVAAEFYEDAGPWSVPLNELCAQAARAATRHREPVISAEMSNGDPLLLALLLGEGLAGAMQFNYTDGVSDADVPVLTPVGRTLRTAGARLVETRRRVDTAIVWCPDLIRLPYQADTHGFDVDVRAVAERHVPALATLLIRAGLSFDLVDVTVAGGADYRAYPTVWLVCGDVLARAAQHDLVDYVANGGRVVCWPSPPRLDEELAPCTVLADALFPEAHATRLTADAQTVSLLGAPVRVWRGVQTYALSPSAAAVAVAPGGAVCGYARGHGSGDAVLLGTFLAADSVPGRAGSIIDIEAVPPGASGAATAVALLARTIARRVPAPALAQAAALVPDSAEYVIVYADPNQRRGGEVVSGGSLAYWDGADVVAARRVNTAETAPPVEVVPHHPVGADHVAAALRLHGRPPIASAGDPSVQVRVLDDVAGGATTVVVLNRRTTDASIALRLDVAGRSVRLPRSGRLRIPPLTPLVLPLDYRLGHGVVVTQATAQLLDATVAEGDAILAFLAPAGGEVVLRLPGEPSRVSVDAAAVSPTMHGSPDGGTEITVTLGAGEHRVHASWVARSGCPVDHGPVTGPAGGPLPGTTAAGPSSTAAVVVAGVAAALLRRRSGRIMPSGPEGQG